MSTNVEHSRPVIPPKPKIIPKKISEESSKAIQTREKNHLNQVPPKLTLLADTKNNTKEFTCLKCPEDSDIKYGPPVSLKPFMRKDYTRLQLPGNIHIKQRPSVPPKPELSFSSDKKYSKVNLQVSSKPVLKLKVNTIDSARLQSPGNVHTKKRPPLPPKTSFIPDKLYNKTDCIHIDLTDEDKNDHSPYQHELKSSHLEFLDYEKSSVLSSPEKNVLVSSNIQENTTSLTHNMSENFFFKDINVKHMNENSFADRSHEIENRPTNSNLTSMVTLNEGSENSEDDFENSEKEDKCGSVEIHLETNLPGSKEMNANLNSQKTDTCKLEDKPLNDILSKEISIAKTLCRERIDKEYFVPLSLQAGITQEKGNTSKTATPIQCKTIEPCNGKGDNYEIIYERNKEHCLEKKGDGKIGHIRSKFDSSNAELDKHPWFYNNITYEQCEDILREVGQDGCFIVREAKSAPYSLSVFKKDRCGMQLTTYRIFQEGKYFHIQGTRKRAFMSIPDLVRYYTRRSGGLSTLLKCAPPLHYQEAKEIFHGAYGLEIELDDLEIFEENGYGSFGEIHRGKFGTNEIAAEIVKNVHQSYEDVLKEAIILSKLSHPNVVQLYGIVSKSLPLMKVTEFMQNDL